MRWADLRLALILAAVLGLGCAEPTQPSGVLLVTLDTTRADRVGAYGHPDAATPRIDRLAAEGIVFERAISPTPTTLPSHASMLTGVYPPVHGVRDNGIFTLGPEAPVVAEAFRDRGWRTGAFVGAFVLDARFGLAQGFEAYTAPVEQTAGNRIHAERPANEVVDDAIDWLSTLPEGQRFFAWVHFFDPHRPHMPPSPWREAVDDPYQGEIAFCDAELGRLLDFLEDSGRADGLRLILTADHGESLGEHGEESHGIFVYQATLHVPLVLWGGTWSRAERVAHPVSTVDVAATLFALAGAETADSLQGRPLVSASGSLEPADPGRDLYVESLLPYHSFRWRALRGLVSGGYKLVDARSPELYDLRSDPDESRDLASAEPERLAEQAERLRRFDAGLERLGWQDQRGTSADERAKLRSLGYLASSPGEEPFAATLPDPRERIGDVQEVSTVATLLRRAELLYPLDPRERARRTPEQIRKGRLWLVRARRRLLALQEGNPSDPHVFVYLGSVESMLGNYGAALPLLERAVELRPGNARLYYLLGMSYDATGRPRAARREIRRASQLDPGSSLYRRWLAGGGF